MLPIYICSRSENDIDIYETIIKAFIQHNELTDARIFGAVTNHEELLRNVQWHMLQSLYFLDYGERNITLAEEIRKYDPRAYIVIINSDDDCIKAAHESTIEPLAVVKKNEGCIELLYNCVDKAYDLYTTVDTQHHSQLSLQLTEREENACIPQRDIYQISASSVEPHCIDIYTETEKFIGRYTLKTIMEELGSFFIKCHREHIVNMQHIIRVDRDKLIIELDNGMTVPCSYRAIKKISF